MKKGDLLFELDPRPFEAEIGKSRDNCGSTKRKRWPPTRKKRGCAFCRRRAAPACSKSKRRKPMRSLSPHKSAPAQNEIDRAELDLEYSRITADIDGRVSKAELTEGNLVNAGGSDPLLTTIVSVDPIRIYFNVDERSMQRYAKSIGAAGGSLVDLLANMKDRKATVSVRTRRRNRIHAQGELRFGDNRVDPSTGTIQLYGMVPNADGMFVPGSRVRVRLTIGKPYMAMLVPDTAILSDQDKRYVLDCGRQEHGPPAKRDARRGHRRRHARDPAGRQARRGREPGRLAGDCRQSAAGAAQLSGGDRGTEAAVASDELTQSGRVGRGFHVAAAWLM